jgi:hypothetical protein
MLLKRYNALMTLKALAQSVSPKERKTPNLGSIWRGSREYELTQGRKKVKSFI